MGGSTVFKWARKEEQNSFVLVLKSTVLSKQLCYDLNVVSQCARFKTCNGFSINNNNNNNYNDDDNDNDDNTYAMPISIVPVFISAYFGLNLLPPVGYPCPADKQRRLFSTARYQSAGQC